VRFAATIVARIATITAKRNNLFIQNYLKFVSKVGENV
jgi:hypothetical protein